MPNGVFNPSFSCFLEGFGFCFFCLPFFEKDKTGHVPAIVKGFSRLPPNSPFFKILSCLPVRLLSLFLLSSVSKFHLCSFLSLHQPLFSKTFLFVIRFTLSFFMFSIHFILCCFSPSSKLS